MVCSVCGGRTEVINSRQQKRSNQVWRRRRCLDCLRVFTTHEMTDLSPQFSVSKKDKEEPFLTDKLFTEVLLALQDRKDCYRDAREATATITKHLLAKADGVVIPAPAISRVTAQVLKRLDRRAWLRFISEHPSQMSQKTSLTERRS